MRRKITDITIQKAADAFATEGSRSEYRKFGSGHINDTFLLTCDRRYILQRLNTEIFKDPIAVIRNIEGVTGFLRKKIVESGGDPDRETLNLVKTSSGRTITLMRWEISGACIISLRARAASTQ